jgi:hypothetical protein
MGALQPPPLPYTKQVNHKRPMTYAFTDTVQIEELGAGWELPLDLNAALEAVDAALDAAYPYLLPPDMVSDGETEWATELAVKGILEGKSPREIAELIVGEWEPSDAEMLASFGTKWHDGL